MSLSCCDFRDAASRQFTAAKAAKELQAYRKGRVGPTTRILRDEIVAAGLNRGSLLDIGGGIAALSFELLDRGMRSAVVVDAAIAYVEAARDEAERRGSSAKLTVLHSDLVEMSEQLPLADVVTLDRVVCCYPEHEPLLRQALRHAERAMALSYPRNRWFVRVAMRLENALRARKSGFRTFVHSPEAIAVVIEHAGFALVRRRTTRTWAVDVFVKVGVPLGAVASL